MINKHFFESDEDYEAFTDYKPQKQNACRKNKNNKKKRIVQGVK